MAVAGGAMRACAGWAAALACLAGAALAEERPPPLRLQQDTTVTYRIIHTGVAEAAGVDTRSLVGQALQNLPPTDVVHLHQAATGRTRSGTSGHVGISDPRAGREWSFDTTATGAARVVRLREGETLGMSVEQAAQDPDFVTVRQGSRQVAGLPCTEWRVRLRDEPEERAMLACFAADGLMLRLVHGSSGMTMVQEALRVERGPLDPALFVPPPGWPVVAE